MFVGAYFAPEVVELLKVITEKHGVKSVTDFIRFAVVHHEVLFNEKISLTEEERKTLNRIEYDIKGRRKRHVDKQQEKVEPDTSPDYIPLSDTFPSSKSQIVSAYSRQEIERKLKDWMVEQFGHPLDYVKEPDMKEQWYRDFGMMYHFICDHFPVESEKPSTTQDDG